MATRKKFTQPNPIMEVERDAEKNPAETYISRATKTKTAETRKNAPAKAASTARRKPRLKTQRVNLIMQPALVDAMRNICDGADISLNEGAARAFTMFVQLHTKLDFMVK